MNKNPASPVFCNLLCIAARGWTSRRQSPQNSEGPDSHDLLTPFWYEFSCKHRASLDFGRSSLAFHGRPAFSFHEISRDRLRGCSPQSPERWGLC